MEARVIHIHTAQAKKGPMQAHERVELRENFGIVGDRCARAGSVGQVTLVSADQLSNTLTVFFQRSAGVFESVSFPLGDLATGLTEAAVSVAALDLDGDGDADIVSANGATATLTVFYGAHEP